MLRVIMGFFLDVLQLQTKNMKVVTVLLVGLMVCSCLAAPRRPMMGGMHDEERVSVENGVASTVQSCGRACALYRSTSVSVLPSVSKVREKWGMENPYSSTDNHHNIPRQDYNQWGSGSGSSSGDDNGNNDNNDSGGG